MKDNQLTGIHYFFNCPVAKTQVSVNDYDPSAGTTRPFKNIFLPVKEDAGWIPFLKILCEISVSFTATQRSHSITTDNFNVVVNANADGK